MGRETELFLFDIFVAIEKIKNVVSDFKSADELHFDFRSWDSVIREFEIIGEASRHLIKNEMLSKEYQIIVDFRNKITHEYFGIDQNIVWQIAQNELKDIEEAIIKAISKVDYKLKIELIEGFMKDNNHLSFITDALNSLR